MARANKVCSCSTGRCGTHTGSCPEIVPAGTGRCPRCDAAADRRRGTAARRGYDARWRRTRAAHLRISPLCERPNCYLAATDVNHLDGLGPRGPRGHDHDNLESLCHSHHSQHTAAEQPGGWHRAGGSAR